MQLELTLAVDTIRQGGIIAYPTEGVFGLGCDPFNKAAVEKILMLKQRSMAKGLIVIAAAWSQIEFLTTVIPASRLKQILQVWAASPTTWVFPKSREVPKWVTGDFPSIALRVTQHPIAKQLCEMAGPLVSTSANIATQPNVKTAAEVANVFGSHVDYIIDAPIGDLQKSTPILNALDGHILRN